MRVTISTVIESADYAPVPGTEYEVAEGVAVKLKTPTVAVRKAFEAEQERIFEEHAPYLDVVNDLQDATNYLQELLDKRSEAEDPDSLKTQIEEQRDIVNRQVKELAESERPLLSVDLAKTCSEGSWPEEDAIIERVVGQLLQDFRSAAGLI